MGTFTGNCHTVVFESRRVAGRPLRMWQYPGPSGCTATVCYSITNDPSAAARGESPGDGHARMVVKLHCQPRLRNSGLRNTVCTASGRLFVQKVEDSQAETPSLGRPAGPLVLPGVNSATRLGTAGRVTQSDFKLRNGVRNSLRLFRAGRSRNLTSEAATIRLSRKNFLKAFS